jgi:hypothetical protein
MSAKAYRRLIESVCGAAASLRNQSTVIIQWPSGVSAWLTIVSAESNLSGNGYYRNVLANES